MNTALRCGAVPSLVFAAILLAGCGSGSSYDGSIYYYLENEQAVKDASLSNTAGFLGVVRLGAPAAPVYYAACGQVRRSTAVTAPGGVRTITWDETAVTPPAGALCNALVGFGGSLYGGFFSSPSAQSEPGLYKATADATTGVLTSDFLQVLDTAMKGKQILRLYVSGEGGGDGRLIAVTAEAVSTTPATTPFTYAIYRSADGTTFQKIHDAGTDQIIDVSWQAASSLYWMVHKNGTKVATIDAATLAVTDRTPGLATGETLAGATTTPGAVYLASRLGKIWKTLDGGVNWTASATATLSGVTVPFLSLAEIPADAGAAAGVYAGSEGYGYYAVGSDLTLTRFAETTYADLNSSAIQRFYVDYRKDSGGTYYGTTLFALTTKHGLWRGEVSGTISWSQE